MPTFTIAKQNTLTLTSDPLRKNNPTIILGLSGGPDSVFMFHVLAKLQTEGHLTLIAAHLDHEWRNSSIADAQFCIELCRSANVPLVNKKASELDLPIKFNGSKEDVGRRLRRHFFQEVQKQYNADFIALAHHRQDQQETFFLRLLRGTTLSGLTCMKEIDKCYIRPLLGIDKQMIVDYLTIHNLPFCTDPTNETDTYLRNRIRKYVIPALKSIDPRFEQKLASTIEHLQEEDSYLQASSQEAFERIFQKKQEIIGRPFPPAPPSKQLIIGSLPEFKKLHSVMQRRVLLRWLITESVSFNPSTSYLDELCRFINQNAGGRHCLGTWSICKKGESLWIERK